MIKIVGKKFKRKSGSTYCCVYDNGWKWSTSEPTGFCCSHADCPAKNFTIGKCDTTGEITGTAYTCYWPACRKNVDCVDGACCGSSLAGGPGGEAEGKCYPKGIYTPNPKYLCDPPEWSSTEESVTKAQNIFELILNFFSQLFFQR